jgi:hypothetical protein
MILGRGTAGQRRGGGTGSLSQLTASPKVELVTETIKMRNSLTGKHILEHTS